MCDQGMGALITDRSADERPRGSGPNEYLKSYGLVNGWIA